MSLVLALAAAAALSTAPAAPPPPARAATPGVVDVSAFDDKGMVRAVAASPCARDNFTKVPDGGCLRRAEHAAPRK